MATTVTPGTPVSFPIGAFDTITVTASPASVGAVSFTAGALSDLRSDVSAGVCNNIYGPYGVPGTVTISVASGVVAYTPNYARGSVATTTAATAAATAYQGPGVTLVDENGAQWVWSGSAYELGAGGVTIVPITADTVLSNDPVTGHNGKTLRLDASRTLTVPEGLGTDFSCIIEWPAGTTATFDPTGATQIQDTATPAGSTATRTRTHSNNPSGVVLKSTGTANVLSLSGS